MKSDITSDGWHFARYLKSEKYVSLVFCGLRCNPGPSLLSFISQQTINISAPLATHEMSDYQVSQE